MTQSVTLDVLDRRLIHALQIDGRASFSRMAAVLKVPERTVARRYQRLRSALVVRVVGLVDSQQIGMLDWFVRIDCTPESTDVLTAALAQRDDTSWIAPLAGGTRLTCMVRTPGAGAEGARPLFDHLLRTRGFEMSRRAVYCGRSPGSMAGQAVQARWRHPSRRLSSTPRPSHRRARTSLPRCPAGLRRRRGWRVNWPWTAGRTSRSWPLPPGGRPRPCGAVSPGCGPLGCCISRWM
ncbi:AsnC family transcriptional regulator [Streptomyces sp. MS1.AVA.1]|uniref:AsnC family transcriptional regulator n=1 Tax=Streptomyces machairae TaxID=3134109 RepID=A0ABU8UVF4_9ACTN